MGKQYRPLSVEDRAVIMIERCSGACVRSMARTLGRNASSISRELTRNHVACATSNASCGYHATASSQACRCRRLRCGRRRRLEEGTALFQHVDNRLVHDRWSPQQIASGLRMMHPDDADRRVSHETIYASIYACPRGSLKLGMIEALRQRTHVRGRRRPSPARGQTVPEALRIVHRPEEIEQRLLPGHWEGDFINGSFNRSGDDLSCRTRQAPHPRHLVR